MERTVHPAHGATSPNGAIIGRQPRRAPARFPHPRSARGSRSPAPPV